MQTIRLQNLTPNVYTDESRDFQVLCRLFDSVFNGIKYDSDTIKYIVDTKNIQSSLLPLLQTKLGFLTKKKLNDNEIRYILRVFPELVRNKGSLNAIRKLINICLKLNDISGEFTISYSDTATVINGIMIDAHTIIVGIDSVLNSTELITEIARYILPAGFSFYIYYYKNYNTTDDILYNQDVKLLYSSSNLNAQVRGTRDNSDGYMDYTMPLPDESMSYNLLGSVDVAWINSIDSEISDNFLGIFNSLSDIPLGDTKTVSGSIVSFSDGADGIPMVSVVADIEPIQDLHGQSSPYPAGGGKNKVLLNADTVEKPSWYPSSWSGTTVNNKNGITQTKGYQQSGYGGFVLSALPAGDYTLSLNYDTSQSNIYVGVWYTTDGTDSVTVLPANTQMVLSSGRASKSFTLPQNMGIAVRPTYVSIASGTSLDLDNIQIEAGSTATAWSPYSNICPISGWDDVNVTRMGKNLITTPLQSGSASSFTYTNYDGGRFTFSGSNGATSAFGAFLSDATHTFTLKANHTYRVAGNWEGLTPSGSTARVDVRGDLNTIYFSENSGSYTPTEDITCRLGVRVAAGYTFPSGAVASPCLTEDNTDTSYEPYTSQTYTTALDTTRYGGTLDVVSGVLTVTHGILVMDGVTSGAKFTNKGGASAFNNFYFDLTDASIMGHSVGWYTKGELTSAGFVVSNMPLTDQNSFLSEGFDYALAGYCGSGLDFQPRLMTKLDTGISNVTAANELLAEWYNNGNPLTFVYPLATPITVHLTPTEITSLLRDNVLFANSGNIAVTYYPELKKTGNIAIALSTVDNVVYPDVYYYNDSIWNKLNFRGYCELSSSNPQVSNPQNYDVVCTPHKDKYLVYQTSAWVECTYRGLYNSETEVSSPQENDIVILSTGTTDYKIYKSGSWVNVTYKATYSNVSQVNTDYEQNNNLIILNGGTYYLYVNNAWTIITDTIYMLKKVISENDVLGE